MTPRQALRSAAAFLTQTRPGRTTVLLFLLGAAALILPRGCTRRGVPTPSSTPAETRDKTAAENLPAAPRGFDETLTLGQRYDALIRRWGNDLAAAKSDLDSARKEIEALRNALAEEKSARSREKKETFDYFRKIEESLRGALAPEPPEPKGPTHEEPHLARAPDALAPGLRTISLSERSTSAPAKFAHIPAASGGRATLLNGVFAPTSGEPLPVRLRFDAAVVGPNRALVPVRNALLIGKAQGDANSSRVTIQVDRLSYVSPAGTPVESKVLGYVVGPDGLEGIPGTYEWRAAELLPYAVAAGFASSGAQALAAGETTRSITPLGGAIEALSGNAARYAGLTGLAGGTSKLSEILADRMREIRPAVSARPGQEVTVVFLEGVTLEGLQVQEIEHAAESDPFSGLDLHR